jgi:hypothetical protein
VGDCAGKDATMEALVAQAVAVWSRASAERDPATLAEVLANALPLLPPQPSSSSKSLWACGLASLLAWSRQAPTAAAAAPAAALRKLLARASRDQLRGCMALLGQYADETLYGATSSDAAVVSALDAGAALVHAVRPGTPCVR